MKTVPVIVTRPERDAGRWVQDLQQLGLQAEALPLLAIAALPDSPALNQAWDEIDAYAALMFVSSNAVDFFFASNQAPALLHRAQAGINLGADAGLSSSLEPRFLATGPGTVAALLGAGVPAALIDAPAADARQFDSETLWALLSQRPWAGQRVLIVRGQSAASGAVGRDWLSRQLQTAGARVDQVAVYQRRAPLFTLAQQQRLASAAHDGSIWLFSSSEALAYLPAQDWSQARALATHPRIAKAVRAAGWAVVAESRPALADILASIESISP